MHLLPDPDTDGTTPRMRDLLPFILGSAEIVKVETYEAAGKAERVYWVSGGSDSRLGKTSLLNAIYLNHDALSELPNSASDATFLHELSHKQRHVLLRIVHIGVILVCFGAALAGAMTVSWLLGLSVVGEAPIELIAVNTGLTLLFVGTGSVVNKTEELAAELYAFYRLDTDAYWRGQEAAHELADPSWGARFRSWLLYPNRERIGWYANTRVGAFLGKRPG
jgi:hypothetical protein